MSFSPFDGEKQMGSINMQTAASKNLVLTACFSFKRLAEAERRVSHAGLYQAIRQILSAHGHTSKSLADLAATIAAVAEHSYTIRQSGFVGCMGQVLLRLPLPRELESVGDYYYALSLNRRGHGYVSLAQSIFEQVAENASPRFRARSMAALGSNSLIVGDHQTAAFFYQEVTRIATTDKAFDPVTFYFTRRMTAVVKAAEGDHRGALADLEKMFPLVRMAGAQQPYAYYDYLNTLAVELTEAGRLDEARNASRIALASPFAHAYPEWRETLDEIEHRRRHASRSTVAVTQRAPQDENLVTLQPPRRESPITARKEGSQPPARVIKFPTKLPTRFPIRTPSTPEQNEGRQGLEPFDKRRIVAEKLYEMLLSAIDDEPLNRDLVEELYKTFLKKRKQS